jgi:dTDP-4-amino-4,6-dideoxygalactose transaminase
MRNGQLIDNRLGHGETECRLLESKRTYWLYPLRSDRPATLIAQLRKHGFDAVQQGRLQTLAPPEDRPELRSEAAEHVMRNTVFLPCYPELPASEIQRMCKVIASVIANSAEVQMAKATTT